MSNYTILQQFKNAIRNIPDFPSPGIQFKDITTAIKQPQLLKSISDEVTTYYIGKKITKVVAVESRGFIFGGVLAYKLNAGFVPVRKPGKLPAEKFSKTYALEYGQDTVEIHKDALIPEDVVLLHDDLLATGGTSLAVIDLIKQFGVRKIFANFLIELDFLKGRDKLKTHCDVFTLIHF